MISEGNAAPAFSSTDQDGTSVSLSDFAGQKVALYFYPKDDTPGCTSQACNLRDNYDALTEHGIVILGVSPDKEAKHGTFIAKHDLPFRLLADTEHELLEAYGVWGEKKLYGRTYMGVFRTTFLIDASGTVVNVITKPKVKDHAAEILSGFGLGEDA